MKKTLFFLLFYLVAILNFVLAYVNGFAPFLQANDYEALGRFFGSLIIWPGLFVGSVFAFDRLKRFRNQGAVLKLALIGMMFSILSIIGNNLEQYKQHQRTSRSVMQDQ